MAIMYCKTSGTKTSGNSTVSDFTDANCYASPKTAVAAITSGWTSSDQIIVLDGTYSFNSIDFGAVAALTGTNIQIVSQSNDPTACILQSTVGTTAMININKSGGEAYTISFAGMRFLKTVAYTTNASGVFTHQPQAAHGDVSFTDCEFVNTTLTIATSSIYGFFNLASNGAGRTYSFTRCLFSGLTSTSLGGVCFAGAAVAGCNVVFDDCDFETLTHDNTASSGFAGGFTSTVGLTITNCRVDGIDIDTKGTTALASYPFFYSTVAMNINGLTANNCILVGGSAGPAVVHAACPWTLNDFAATNCSSTPATDVNTTGGTFLANGPTAQGTGSNIIVDTCISNHGVGLYFTQGGGGVIDGVRVYRSTSRVQAIISASGWGDVSIDDFQIIDCVTGTIIDPSDAGLGGAIYAHNHAIQATRDAVRSFTNGAIIGVTNKRDGGYNAIFLRNGNSTYAHSVRLENIYCDTPGQLQPIGFSETAGCALNLTGATNTINGGQYGVYEDFQGTGSHALSDFADVGTVRRGVMIGNSVTRRAA